MLTGVTQFNFVQDRCCYHTAFKKINELIIHVGLNSTFYIFYWMDILNLHD